MLLRNKKTGEVFDVIVREKSNGDGEYSTIVCNLRSIRSARSVSPILGEYDSLDKLNEEWEDYKPAEPLIKDEKIRKAVRAWAEANEMEFMDIIDDSTIKDCSSKHIEFLGLPFRELPKVSVYIDELCGEEEE